MSRKTSGHLKVRKLRHAFLQGVDSDNLNFCGPLALCNTLILYNWYRTFKAKLVQLYHINGCFELSLHCSDAIVSLADSLELAACIYLWLLFRLLADHALNFENRLHLPRGDQQLATHDLVILRRIHYFHKTTAVKQLSRLAFHTTTAFAAQGTALPTLVRTGRFALNVRVLCCIRCDILGGLLGNFVVVVASLVYQGLEIAHFDQLAITGSTLNERVQLDWFICVLSKHLLDLEILKQVSCSQAQDFEGLLTRYETTPNP